MCTHAICINGDFLNKFCLTLYDDLCIFLIWSSCFIVGPALNYAQYSYNCECLALMQNLQLIIVLVRTTDCTFGSINTFIRTHMKPAHGSCLCAHVSTKLLHPVYLRLWHYALCGPYIVLLLYSLPFFFQKLLIGRGGAHGAKYRGHEAFKCTVMRMSFFFCLFYFDLFSVCVYLQGQYSANSDAAAVCSGWTSSVSRLTAGMTLGLVPLDLFKEIIRA